jgi:hypothetical protein
MNPQLTNRAIAAAILGVMFGWYIHHDYTRWSQLGREAFIAHDVHRFDQYMAVPRPIGLTMFGAVVVAIGLFGLYELIAFVLSKILRTTTSGGGNS